MNIIFGQDIQDIKDRYVILELDTFAAANGEQQTAYCLIESIPESDWPVIETYRQAHHDLMAAYRAQNWEYCRHTIDGLHGRWNGEMDTFYEDLAARVAFYTLHPPGEDWTGVRSIQDLQ